MAEGRKTKLKDQMEGRPEMKVELASEAPSAPEPQPTPEQLYLKRKAEVLQQDNDDFSRYLRERKARDEQEAAQPADAAQKTSAKLNRRSILTWAAGTAVVGEAVV